MCGIAGVFGKPDPATVEAMLARLAHRGPNDQFLVSGPRFTLGAGQVINPRTVDVNIPPGAREGSVIKLKGQGQPGDLLVRLRIAPHRLYQVSGDDVTVELPIAPWEAVLGSNVSVPTLDGKAEIEVPAGSQGGQRLRLKGRGLNKRGGGRGDAYIKLKIVVPTNPGNEEKEMYRKLSEKSKFEPRPG